MKNKIKNSDYPSKIELDQLTFDYGEMIWHLTENTSVERNQIYDIDGYSQDDFCIYLFNFYNKNLEWNRRFRCAPSYVIFGNETFEGAKAKKSNNHYIIIFFKGLIEKLKEWFSPSFSLENIQGLDDYKMLEERFNFPIAELIKQAILNFTFYHEFAHLLQFYDNSEFDREENFTAVSGFDYLKHIEEFDADTFAGVCLATHLFQFKENWISEDANSQDLLMFISLITGSIMTYILSLPMCKSQFYIKECIHPHNSVRALNALGVISSHFDFILKRHNIDINLDISEVYRPSNQVAINLLNYFDLETIADSYVSVTTLKHQEIAAYHKVLTKELIDYEKSAIKKWNLYN